MFDLVGCVVRTLGGEVVGPVERVDLATGVAMLVVAGDGFEVLVPFTEVICKRIDTAAREIDIDPAARVDRTESADAAMIADVITIFPDLVEAALGAGVVGRARERGVVDVRVHDLRDFTDDRHRTVDDLPYGGGPGMVMKPEPLWKAVEAIAAERGAPSAVVLMTPQGRRADARRGARR